MKVWIHINGIQEGPYEIGQLPLHRIKPDTPVWYEGLDYWKEAAQAPEVARLISKPQQPYEEAEFKTVNTQAEAAIERGEAEAETAIERGEADAEVLIEEKKDEAVEIVSVEDEVIDNIGDNSDVQAENDLHQQEQYVNDAGSEEEQPYSGQSQGNQPYGNQPYGNQPYGDHPYGDHPYGDHPYGEQPYGNQPYGNQPYGNQPYGDQPCGDQPYGDQPYGNQPYAQQLSNQILNRAYNQAYAQQGGYNPSVEDGKESPTYLIWAILVTLLCCNPIGIIAVITSVMTRRRLNNYDYAGAKRMSQATAWWIMIAIVTSLIMAPFMSIISL